MSTLGLQQQITILRQERDDAVQEAKRLQKELNSWELTNERLFRTGELSDFKVLVGPEKKVFEVHKVIICLEYEYFRKCCCPSWQEGQEGTLELEDMEVEDMEVVLGYSYRGLRLPRQTFEIPQLKRLFSAADYLIMPGLKRQVGTEIIRLTREALHEDGRDVGLAKDCMKLIMEEYVYFKGMMQGEEGTFSEEIEGLIRQVRIEGTMELLNDQEVRRLMTERKGLGLWLWDVFIFLALRF